MYVKEEKKRQQNIDKKNKSIARSTQCNRMLLYQTILCQVKGTLLAIKYQIKLNEYWKCADLLLNSVSETKFLIS
jgi:hypothetical protein